MKGIILAGGFGSRLHNIWLGAKAMETIKPLGIEHVMHQMKVIYHKYLS